MEVIGACSSAIAFAQAAQGIVKCIVKTQQLWDQLKDIPEELSYLIKDLKISETEFRAIEVQFSDQTTSRRFWDDFAAKECLTHAQDAHALLETLVLELNNQLKDKKGVKQKIALAKAFRKRDMLERCEKRLERASKHLATSMRLYQVALLKQIPELVAARITNEVLPQFSRPRVTQRATVQYQNVDYLSDEHQHDEVRVQKSRKETKLAPRSKAPVVTNTWSVSRWGRYAMTYTRDSGAWRASVQWPSWLSEKIYELHSSPTVCGWNYSFRSYNIVAKDSAIIQRVRSGDRNGVLELFSASKASPFDRDTGGNSLIHHAVDERQYDICQLLLTMGLSEFIGERAGMSNDPLSMLVMEPDRSNPDGPAQRLIELFQSYLPDPTSNFIEQLYNFSSTASIQDDYVRIFQQRFIPKIHDSLPRIRFEAVRIGCFHVQSPDTLLRLLRVRGDRRRGDENMGPKSDILLATREKISLIHSAAIGFGIRYADEMLPYERAHCQWHIYNDSWAWPIKMFAAAAGSDDLHAIEMVAPLDAYIVPVWRGSPLISAIGAALCFLSTKTPFSRWDSVLQGTLRQWVKVLQGIGVDVFEYGQREAQLLREEMKAAFDADTMYETRHVIRDPMPPGMITLDMEWAKEAGLNETRWVPIRLLDLEIGANPEDWRIVWVREYEYLASQFWTMIEKESIVMPGSWIEG